MQYSPDEALGSISGAVSHLRAQGFGGGTEMDSLRATHKVGTIVPPKRRCTRRAKADLRTSELVRNIYIYLIVQS